MSSMNGNKPNENKIDESYREYAEKAIEQFAAFGEARRYLLVNELKNAKIETVLDVGCSAGQEMLPFAEKTGAFCVGADVSEQVGEFGGKLFAQHGFAKRAAFVCAKGEHLPFAAESFDVVICRVALPYMDNRRTLAEISRVLKPEGYFFLKIHAPRFYFGMLKRRFRSFNPKQLAYPAICLAGGAWFSVVGSQPQGGFWSGKEVFQTESFLRREFARNSLRIEKQMPDTNAETPSYLIRKL
jgi:ubiquinone/menaquinone biosynthesis C-methylase UbiE